MTLTPSPLATWGRVALGLAAAAAMFGPSLAAFATSRIQVPPPTRLPVEVIGARAFPDLAGAARAGVPALHVGPTERTSGLRGEAALRARMNDAASRCALRSSAYLVLSASVDGRGRITEVRAEAGGDRPLGDCATSLLRQGGTVETRGPGTLEIGYFMGRARG
ncbi:MAG TPA: hypothetical protein VN853_00885 [Polyangia bacterium]|jgi:hypothetical protein|nr:hypothetical protein [Polyangia bacterium]